jgi:hypothetical protein
MTLPAELIVTGTDHHLGTLWSGTPINLGPYTTNAGTHVPAHWWNAVFRDRQAPFIFKNAPADIVAANRMFPFGDTGAHVPNVTAPPYTPMGSSSITLYMPTTGERPDIGLLSDASAHFMRTGDAAAMLAWAQCAASCPVHFRDENTGKPISLLQYPKANCYPDNKNNAPWLDYGPPTPTSGGYHQFGGNWTPQQAHYTEFGSYLAFLATHDTGFLEDLQYSANFTTGIADAYHSTDTMTITSGEMRGMAWAFRNLFMVHAATKDAETLGILPNSCHPSSYWKTLLDNQLAHQVPCMSDPANQTFRLLGGPSRFGPWQCDYVLASIAFGILTGHSEWAPLYLFLFGNVIARTSGKSGYPVAWSAYYLNTCPWLKQPDGSWDYNNYDTSKPFTWAQAFDWLQNDTSGTPPSAAQLAALKADPYNGGNAMAGYESLMATRAVIVQAQYLHKLGLVDVKSVYPDLDLCFTNADRMIRNGNSVNPRQSYVLDASQAPTQIPPLPPVTPPPDVPPPVIPPVISPPEKLPATIAGIKTRVDRLKTKVGA